MSTRDEATLSQVSAQASFEKNRVNGRMGQLSRSLSRSMFGRSGDDVTLGDDINDEGTLTPRDLRLIIRLQNRWRAVRLSAYHFAPTYFRRHDGLPAVHGQLSFQRSVSYFVASSPYMVLNSASSPSLVNRLLTRFWGLPEPELILDVTGSAQDMLLDQSNEYALRRALTILSKLGNVWVISAGTDTGIMKILGSTIRAIESEEEIHIPLVGIVPFGATNNFEMLVAHAIDDRNHLELTSGDVEYPHTFASREGAALNPNHSHFLLVDDGTRGAKAWGCEIPLRSALVNFYVTDRILPVVQLVVRGGPGTVQTVAKLPANVPVVVMAGTGGAAQMIQQACRQLTSEKSDDIEEEKTPQWDAATLEALRAIRAAHEHNPQKFSFFDPKSPEHNAIRDVDA